jgi:glycine dehydrogenase subunit 2
MIEPTETETKRNLDAFAAAMQQIAVEAADDLQILKDAPTTAPVRRLDEVTAARRPILKYNAARFRELRRLPELATTEDQLEVPSY